MTEGAAAMTDPDNLRNRIAAKILDNFNPPDDKHPSWWINPEASAQAIIDELGLTTETHAATHAKRNMTRITSAWEWDN